MTLCDVQCTAHSPTEWVAHKQTTDINKYEQSKKNNNNNEDDIIQQHKDDTDNDDTATWLSLVLMPLNIPKTFVMYNIYECFIIYIKQASGHAQPK